MIQIDDFDSPIQVAEKIVSGTKKVPANMLDKAAKSEPKERSDKE